MRSHYNLPRSAFYFECNYFWNFCCEIRTLGNYRSSLIRLTATARRTLQTINPVASVRGCLYIWYRNDFHSGIIFVPEWSLFWIHMVKSKDSYRGSRSPGFRARSCTTGSRYSYTICDFQCGTKFVLSLHDTRMKFRTRTRISLGMKTGMNSFWNNLYGGEMSFRYHVKKYSETYADGMNSFQN